MRRFIRSLAKWAIVAVASALVSGCFGEEGPTGVKPPPPPPPPPTFVSARVVGPATIVAGTTPSVGLVGVYPDGSTAPLSGGTFATSKYDIADVTKDGVVIPARVGRFEVRATYPGLVVAPLSVEIVGTPWSTWPWLTPDDIAFIEGHEVDSRGAITRIGGNFPGTVITAWFDPGFAKSSVDSALTLWTTDSMKFVVVTDSTKAVLIHTFDPSIDSTKTCGEEGTYAADVKNNVIIRSHGRYSPAKKCRGAWTLAHGTGHMLSFVWHTEPDGTDIMSSPHGAWILSPRTARVRSWKYSIAPGTIPVNK